MASKLISAILWTLVGVNFITLVVGGLITWLGYAIPARLRQFGLLPELTIIAGFASLIVACIGLCALNYSSYHALNVYGASCTIFVLLLVFGIPDTWYKSSYFGQGNLGLDIVYFSLLFMLLVLLAFAFTFAHHLRRKEEEEEDEERRRVAATNGDHHNDTDPNGAENSRSISPSTSCTCYLTADHQLISANAFQNNQQQHQQQQTLSGWGFPLSGKQPVGASAGNPNPNTSPGEEMINFVYSSQQQNGATDLTAGSSNSALFPPDPLLALPSDPQYNPHENSNSSLAMAPATMATASGTTNTNTTTTTTTTPTAATANHRSSSCCQGGVATSSYSSYSRPLQRPQRQLLHAPLTHKGYYRICGSDHSQSSRNQLADGDSHGDCEETTLTRRSPQSPAPARKQRQRRARQSDAHLEDESPDSEDEDDERSHQRVSQSGNEDDDGLDEPSDKQADEEEEEEAEDISKDKRLNSAYGIIGQWLTNASSLSHDAFTELVDSSRLSQVTLALNNQLNYRRSPPPGTRRVSSSSRYGATMRPVSAAACCVTARRASPTLTAAGCRCRHSLGGSAVSLSTSRASHNNWTTHSSGGGSNTNAKSLRSRGSSSNHPNHQHNHNHRHHHHSHNRQLANFTMPRIAATSSYVMKRNDSSRSRFE